jgi:hypothetical protein
MKLYSAAGDIGLSTPSPSYEPPTMELDRASDGLDPFVDCVDRVGMGQQREKKGEIDVT